MTRPACLALLLAVLTPAAYPCEEFDDPEVQRAEYVLNHVYAKVWGQADTDGRELLDRAQLAWLEYRDASCAAAGMRDGVTAHDPFVTCVLFMTRGRTFELQLVGGTSQAVMPLDINERSCYFMHHVSGHIACFCPHQR